MEWKMLWNGQMEATLLWLADLHGVNQHEHPTPQKEFHMIKPTKRLREGHTRGILQILDPEKGRRATIDFLHRTAFEWIQEPDNWDHIIGMGPSNYHPVSPIIAVLVSHALSLAPFKHNEAPNTCIDRTSFLPEKSLIRQRLVSSSFPSSRSSIRCAQWSLKYSTNLTSTSKKRIERSNKTI
ncbi:hypothetical protein BDW59DRAFT_153631 [Aspergillus cavernicola]|uniref:Uncharacterized protein n=1 Tax=Aspergillus cavernicola TaxID=176166 RepID=A0ABR4HK95_9EURO